MPEDEGLSDLIGRVHEAAADAGLWPKVLAAMAARLGAEGGILFVGDTATSAATFWSSARIEKKRMEALRENYRPLEFFDRMSTEFPAAAIVTRDRLMPDRDYEKCALYKDILGAARIWHAMVQVALKDGAAIAAIGFHRPRRAAPFDEADFRKLRTLSPHLARAVRLQQRIAGLELQLGNAAEVLDRLPLGVVLVDPRGRVITMNRCAKEIVAGSEGLHVDRAGNCRAGTPDERPALAQRIADAARADPAKGAQAGGAMRLSRASGRRPLSVLVAPLTGMGTRAGRRRGAILYVRDPELGQSTSAAVLADAYGLTASEAKLLRALIQGKRLEDAAAEFGVSINTIKTHLQNIFRKTATTRQSELLSLVLTGPAPLAAGETP